MLLEIEHPAMKISASEFVSGQKAPPPIPLATLISMEESLYHSRPELSNSKIKLFSKNPREFFRRYVSMENFKVSDTVSLAKGRAFHRAMLEPDRFSEMYAISREQWDLRTKAGTAARDRFEAENPGKLIIRRDDWDGLDDAIEAAYANPDLEAIIRAPGLHEVSIFWDMNRSHGLTLETILPMRSRIDKMCFQSCGEYVYPSEENIREADTIIQLDLKLMASGDPRSFSWDSVRYGYHQQSMVYEQAIREAFPDKQVKSYYGVIAKDEPCAYLFQFDKAFREAGWAEFVSASNDLVASILTECWPIKSGGFSTVFDPRRA